MVDLPWIPRSFGDKLKFHFALIALRPGAGSASVIQQLTALPGMQQGTFFLWADEFPTPVAQLRDVQALPVALGVFLLLLALGAVGHALATAVRRRRVDVAVLRALGMTRWQSRGLVVTQASVLAIAGLLIGVPLGVALGRTIWRTVADYTPVEYVPPLALVALLLVGPSLSSWRICWPPGRGTRPRGCGSRRSCERNEHGDLDVVPAGHRPALALPAGPGAAHRGGRWHGAHGCRRRPARHDRPRSAHRSDPAGDGGRRDGPARIRLGGGPGDARGRGDGGVRGHGLPVLEIPPGDLAVGYPPADDELMRSVERPVVFAGRLADPTRVDEAVVTQKFVTTYHKGVGDRVTAVLPTPQEAAGALTIAGHLPSGPRISIRTVGVVRSPWLSDGQQSHGRLLPTPAMLAYRANLLNDYNWLDAVIRLQGGEAAIPAFAARLAATTGRSDLWIQSQAERWQHGQGRRHLRGPLAVGVRGGGARRRHGARRSSARPSRRAEPRPAARVRALGMRSRQLVAASTMGPALAATVGGASRRHRCRGLGLVPDGLRRGR